MNIRAFGREYGWTPQQVLSAPAQLLRDLAVLSRYERELGSR